MKTGRLLVNSSRVRLADVYMGVLQALGIDRDSFGDSDGTFSLT